MANTFKRVRAELTTTLATIYTVPASTTTIVIGAQIANKDGVNSVDVDLVFSDGTDAYISGKDTPLPAKNNFGPLHGKAVLETGDTVKGKASANGDADLWLSILEIT